MTVLAVVSVAASRIIFAATNAYAGSAARSHLSAEGSAAMERITAELRSIPSRAGAPGTPWIDSVSAASISWGGGTLSRSADRVVLALDGDAARTLLSDVSAFSVACFDADNQPLPASLSGSACHAVRRIEITLTLSRSGANETLRTRVFPRCATTGAAP